MTETAAQIEEGAKLRILDVNKTGRTYSRGAIKKSFAAKRAGELLSLGVRGKQLDNGKLQFNVGAKIHRASAPGESPASDTGNLANSIKHTEAVITTNSVTASVTVNARYGRALEFGTKKIKPRPYLRPASETVKADFIAKSRDAING